MSHPPFEEPDVDPQVLKATLSPRWIHFLKLNLELNVRFGPPLPLQIWRVYHVDVPADAGGILFLQAATSFPSKFTFEKWGKKYYRLFFVNHEKNGVSGKSLYQMLSDRFGRPRFSHYGVKLRSKNTFLVWSAEQFDPSPFALKLQGDFVENGRHSLVNVPESGVRSVRHSQILAALVLEKPPETFKPILEPLVLSVHLGKEDGYTMLFRELPDETSADIPLPLHAFMVSPELTRAARAMGLSDDEWIQNEYIPKFAQFVFESQVIYGIYFPDHTQNLGIDVDFTTGRIRLFYPSDAHDILFDAITAGHNFSPDLLAALQKINPISILNVTKIFADGCDVCIPAYNLFHFANQSVQFDFHTLSFQTELLVRFIREYQNLLAAHLENTLGAESATSVRATEVALNDLRELAVKAGKKVSTTEEESHRVPIPEIFSRSQINFYKKTKDVFIPIFENFYHDAILHLALRDRPRGKNVVRLKTPALSPFHLRVLLLKRLLLPVISYLQDSNDPDSVFAHLPLFQDYPEQLRMVKSAEGAWAFEPHQPRPIAWIPHLKQLKEIAKRPIPRCDIEL